MPLVSSEVSESEPDTRAKTSAAADPRSIGMVFLCTLMGAAAQILMKRGANELSGGDLAGILTNLPLIAGYACYGVNTILLVLALRRGHLSVLYPIIALTYVWVTILSPLFFQDPVNGWKVAGVGLIVLGVSLIGVGSRE